MVALFDPARHEPLTTTPWRDDAARQAIREIVDDTLAAFDAGALWPSHPLDDPEPATQRFADLYFGAAGVIWALHWLQREGAIDGVPSFDDALARLPQRLRDEMKPTAEYLPSFLMGDAGLLLLQWQHGRDAAVAQRLFDVVQGNGHHPSLEVLWGSPGTLMAAIFMADATGEPRWATLLVEQLQWLAEQLQPDPETGLPIWTQDMYGRQVRYLGATHGLIGNVFTALRAGGRIPAALREVYLDAAWRNLQALALKGESGWNWHPMSDAQRAAARRPLVQDCHGAPGIVCRLAGTTPRTDGWDELLRQAGELTWAAGPVTKGPSLCHGTGGNALALMKLGERFNDGAWWQRGRALAWHAAEQTAGARRRYGRGRYSLWTGDLGVACVLWAGLSGRAPFPTLDVF